MYQMLHLLKLPFLMLHFAADTTRHKKCICWFCCLRQLIRLKQQYYLEAQHVTQPSKRRHKSFITHKGYKLNATAHIPVSRRPYFKLTRHITQNNHG